MPRWIETDSLSNQDIHTALAVGAYTADADRLILVQVFADQVAGDGDYTLYLTHQIAGAGSHYRHLPITTANAASGVTAIAAQSGMIAVRSGDVLTVYLLGLAGDTTTPDTTVRWFEMPLPAVVPGASGGLALVGSQMELDATGVDAVLDEVVEGSYTLRHYLRLFASVLLGKATGGGTATLTFRDTGDSKNRVVLTVDTSGNRSAVTLTEG